MSRAIRVFFGAALLCGAFLGLTGAGAQTAGITIQVDAAANRHPIDPRIYGTAFASPAALAELNAPVHRSGGNNTSRYNWQQNADNRGFDWYFESIPESDATPGARGDAFIRDSRGAGAEPMLTLPMLQWVAKLGPNRSKLASFSIAKYGAQTDRDWQWFPDAGNGVSSATGQSITGNDPNDANTPSTAAFQQAWVQHLVQTWGAAGSGGLRYYILDNEPSIWHSTHRDVHPQGAGMDEIRDRMIAYARAVKDVDPGALVVGPEEWGWSGYFLSGKDQQAGPGVGWDWSRLPDRSAHGGADYLPWLLDQLRQEEVSGGRRLLDVFTVHYYPQGGEFSSDTSTAMQQRRNRSTRSLWDPNYVDESWINDRVRLIPRLKGWVNSFYPGLQVGLTEYNWGAEGHINGATTQADLYGIFGREGLDLAARWTTPDPSTPTFKAMKLYRNYDGQKNGFGDTSVLAAAPNPDNVSAFAAQRSSDGALTLMLINKQIGVSQGTTVSLASFAPGAAAQRWQLTSTNVITREADLALPGATFSLTLPAQSITLLVIPAGSGTPPPPGPAFTSSASASPASVQSGAVTTLSASVTCTGGSLSGGVVSLDVHDPNGVKVAGQQWTSQSFTSGQQQGYSFNWIAPAAAGTYSLRVSVAAAGGSPVYHANQAAGSVTVTSAALSFSSSASASPSSVPAGQSTAITAGVTCTGGSLSSGIVDVEVYDAAGTKVGQQFWEGQSFAAGDQKSYLYNWTAPTAAGTYTIKIGVFTSGWAQNPHWNNAAGLVTVTSGAASGTGLKGEYFSNATLAGSPVLTRVDPTVNFSWGNGSPGAAVPRDNFSARWTGQVQAPATGSYTFYAVSDQGIRVWVNGALVVDDWTAHSSREKAGTPISLTAGQKYSVKIEYYELTKGATARLLWSYPGQAKVTVPQARLYP